MSNLRFLSKMTIICKLDSLTDYTFCVAIIVAAVAVAAFFNANNEMSMPFQFVCSLELGARRECVVDNKETQTQATKRRMELNKI